MTFSFFPFLKFHVTRWFNAQPVTFSVLSASSFALLVAMVVYVQQWQAADDATKLELATRALSLQPVVTSAPVNPVSTLEAALPAFNSAELVAALNSVAGATKLPIDEVTFALDETANQPYMRYRITLTASASYPVVRRFLDKFRRDVAHVSLDSIICTRDGMSAANTGLSCDLAFFAFYRRA
jgi:hypothetical protein